ncbi:MAG: hypothetical protein AAFQ80_02160 [Cyanobacteria bacterium J06621_8]
MKYWQKSGVSLISSLLAAYINLSLKTEVKAAEINLGTVLIEDTEWFVEKQQTTISQLSNGNQGRILAAPYPGATTNRKAAFRKFLTTIDPQGQKDWDIKERITYYGYDVLYTTGFMDFRGLDAYLVPVAVFSGEQMYTFTLITPRKVDRDQVKQSFGNLLAAIRLPEASAPANNPQSSQKLDGFYVTIGSKTGVSVVGQVQLEVGAKGLWIQPDGRYALTESGMTGEFDAYCERLPKNCGRYIIADGQYATWRKGSTNDAQLQLYKVNRESFTQSGQDLLISKTKYRYVPPASNLKLTGDYRLLRAGATNNIGGQSSSGYVENIYGFSADGRFVKGGSMSMLSNFGGSSVLTSGNRQMRQGTYEINGYTLTLKFADGETQTKAFFILDGVPAINGDLYEKIN